MGISARNGLSAHAAEPRALLRRSFAMTRLLCMTVLAAGLAACSPQSASDEEPPPGAAADGQAETATGDLGEGRVPLNAGAAGSLVLTPAGLGNLEIGEAVPEESSWSEDEVQIPGMDCKTLHSSVYPESYAMSDGTAIRRITVGMGSEVKAGGGIGPGASEADVRGAFPAVTEEPHKYVEAPAKYLTWMPEGATRGLRFELDAQGKVNLIHAGEMPWLAYVEGCA